MGDDYIKKTLENIGPLRENERDAIIAVLNRYQQLVAYDSERLR